MSPRSRIDRDDVVPLYHQIFLALRDDIFAGKLPFDAVLPTEAEVSLTMQVSRITARRALNELAAHGLVERRRRTGTRVVFRSPTLPLEGSIDQAVESLIAFGRKTKVSVREIVRTQASAEIAARLQLESGAPVVRVVRVRSLDGEPLGEVVNHAPASVGRLITRTKLASLTLLEVLQAAGLRLGEARQSISAVQADAALARALQVDARSPVLRVERVLCDTSGTPLLLTVARYRGDRYRISLDLQGERPRS